MTLTILFDARIGFMGTTSMAILNAVMIGNNIDFIIVGMTLSSMAIYNVRELRTRTQVFTTIFSLLFISFLILLFLIVIIFFVSSITFPSIPINESY